MSPDLTQAAVLAPGFAEPYWLPADYWDLSIPVYLFLAVVAGGGFLTGASASLLGSRTDADADGLEGELARWGFLVAVVGAAGAGLAVLSHLAVIHRALLFPIYLTNFGSWITIGTWILVLLAVVAVLSLAFEVFGEEAADQDGASLFPRTIVAKLGLLETIDSLVDRVRPSETVLTGLYVVGGVLALGTVYTGFELAIVETVPLWNMPVVVPAAFLLTGLASGVGLTVAVTALFEREVDSVLGGYAVVTGLCSGIGLAVVWYGWTGIATSDAPAAAASSVALSEGSLAVGSWLVVVGLAVGLLAGLVVGGAALVDRRVPALERAAVPALVGSFGLLVVGSLALRIVLLLAAQQDPVVVVG
ncbi:dehydrogenase [Halobiforma nitratireducens]|nr:dehydrogenase [Halobiforma nitratireducens]